MQKMAVAANQVRKPRRTGRHKTPRSRKPEGMTYEEWQVVLRREYGREQKFRLQKNDHGSIFASYAVTNPASKRTYRVAIRGQKPGCNFCTCPDYAVNTLGTCKHIEFVLGKIEKTKAGRAALASGFHPAFSEVYLRYGSKREVIFSRGVDCPEGVCTWHIVTSMQADCCAKAATAILSGF